jgi:hypothetical protein
MPWGVTRHPQPNEAKIWSGRENLNLRPIAPQRILGLRVMGARRFVGSQDAPNARNASWRMVTNWGPNLLTPEMPPFFCPPSTLGDELVMHKCGIPCALIQALIDAAIPRIPFRRAMRHERGHNQQRSLAKAMRRMPCGFLTATI